MLILWAEMVTIQLVQIIQILRSTQTGQRERQKSLACEIYSESPAKNRTNLKRNIQNISVTFSLSTVNNRFISRGHESIKFY